MNDVKTIAAGLTEAGRTILLRCEGEWFTAKGIGSNSASAEALYRRGLVERRGLRYPYNGAARYRLTPLGLAVRAELERGG